MSVPSKIDIVVIGAGFAGLSTAHHLVKKSVRCIVVLEQEGHLGGHASGRNAGMIRQAVSDPVLARLAAEGRDALQNAKDSGFKDFGFRSIGSLLLAKGKEVSELEKTKKTLRSAGLNSEFLSRDRIARKAPPAKDADFERALFCPSDAVVDIEALLSEFIRILKKKRVPVLCGYKLEAIKRRENGFQILAGGKIFFARKIVNAAGAWAGIVGEKAGAARIPFRAYRRHLFLSAASVKVNPSWPFVWDLSRHLYFRPKGKRFLVSPCDKKLFRLDPGKRKNTAERLDSEMRKATLRKLKKFSPYFNFLRLKEGKAGLRTMTPDGRFVIGEDPQVPGFFWVAGLGGHGVTTSFSIGRLAADIILGHQKEDSMTKALSPARFFRN